MGHERRFIDVYRQHFPHVWRSLRRLGVPERAVDDAAQDVFVVVHRRLGDFEGRSKESSWVYGIAIRVARKYRERAAQAAHAPIETEPVSTGPSPFDEVSTAEAARMLDRLLDGLDDAKREVFVLAELEGMSAPEIATCLELKLNTVYSRLRAARFDFERALSRLQAGRRREKR